jgi:glycosyltransferase involved in cell wall biosynthesis
VDIEVFKPNSEVEKTHFTIGTIKSLEAKYGISDLIETFSLLLKEKFSKPLKLLVVGDGTQREFLENLVKEKGLSDVITFTGKVRQEEVASYHRQLDVFVALSVDDSESFGVSTVEAMSCAVPVVVSDVSGFKEVVKDKQTGFIVSRNSPIEAAQAIQHLLLNKMLRQEMGKKAREHVINEYDWQKNLSKAVALYRKFISK